MTARSIPVTFFEGEEYEIGPELLQSFIDLGVVESGRRAGGKIHGDAPRPIR